MTIIERLKTNKEAFGLMDAELREVAEKIGREHFDYAYGDKTLYWGHCGPDTFTKHVTYRLRADWACDHRETKQHEVAGVTVCCWCGVEVKPEPKAGWVEYRVSPADTFKGRIFFERDGWHQLLYKVFGLAGFGGIRFADCKCVGVPSIEGIWHMEFPSPCEKCGPFRPVAVRFWEAKK